MQRFIIESIDGEFLDLEFPLDPTDIGETLNGAAHITGTLSPDSGVGVPVAQPHQTFLHEERDGQIVKSCIVTRCEFQGAVWQIEAFGFSSYLKGLVYDGDKKYVKKDPLDIVRELWENAQSRSDIGVTVTGHSKVTVGEPERDVSFTTSSGEDVEFEAGPYKLNWYDNSDMGKKFDELVKASEMDFVEVSAWNAGKTAITKEVRFVAQRGRKRTDLKFVQGENVSDVVPFVADGEDYCNHVLAIGAGEGAKALRVEVSEQTDRLRRSKVVEAKSVRSKKVLEVLARDALREGLKAFDVEAVEVDGLHSFARRSEIRVGDWITVEADVPWIGRQVVEKRIIETADNGRFVNVGF